VQHVALGARLRELRVGKGQSLQQVADAVCASKAHVWELEKGTSRNPSMELLTKLADHFGVTVASLVGEAPSAPGEDPEVVAMYRELKTLTERDRETIRVLMRTLKERSKPAGDEG
jgi:transcriptional regulator with XRE-family HTH domain